MLPDQMPIYRLYPATVRELAMEERAVKPKLPGDGNYERSQIRHVEAKTRRVTNVR